MTGDFICYVCGTWISLESAMLSPDGAVICPVCDSDWGDEWDEWDDEDVDWDDEDWSDGRI